jgi:hypothetical protein
MFIAPLLLLSSCTSPQNAALFDELELIYPDTPTFSGNTILKSDGFLGAPTAVHGIFSAPDSLENSDIGIVEIVIESNRPDDLDGMRLFQLADVPVEENTGLGSRTEQFDGKINPYVVRRAPFRVYEVIQPALLESGKGVLKLKDGRAAFRLELASSRATEIDKLELSIQFKLDGRLVQPDLKWQIQIHRVTVSPPSKNTLHYTNWFAPNQISSKHHVTIWSKEFWPLLRAYAEMMAAGRQNTFWIRLPDFFDMPKDHNDLPLPRLNRYRFEKYVKTFQEAGLYWMEGAPIAHRPDGDWSKDWLELAITFDPATSDNGQAALKSITQQLLEVLKENDWQDRWIQHLADEPTDTNAKDYAKLANQIRGFMPGVRIVEATMTRELSGAIDIWCPQIQKYHANQDFFKARREAGDQIWVYTCLVPGGAWLNRLLDQERLRQVYVGWAAVHYDLDGFLHWGLNHYKADPFKQSVVDHPAQPNTTNKLPAGDTHIIYPGIDGPWSSQRFEAHRIGMEDRELLLQLKQKNPSLAADVIDQVFRAANDYETSVAVYRHARRKLLLALGQKR